MNRFAPLILAAAAFVTHPAVAATYYAKPVTQPEASRIIERDIRWTCGPDSCLGSTEQSRPLVLCQGLAKTAGRLTSFVANGRAFGAAQLDKCNAFAKQGAATEGSLATAN